jgi:hypothetical protein
MAHDVFISYAVQDKPTADAVCARLETERIRCWIAPRDVTAGVSYAEALIDAISDSSLMVLVFSSWSNSSPQVMREVERAASKGIPILPFRIEDVAPSKSMEFFLSTPHWLDALTPPLEKHLGHLAGTVRLLLARVGKPGQIGAEQRPPKSARAPEVAPDTARHRPTVTQNVLETTKRWFRSPIIRLAAGVAIAVAVVLLAAFVVTGLLSGDDDNGKGLVIPALTPDEGRPTVTAHTPLPSPTPASTPPAREVVTEVTAKGFAAPGRNTRGLAWDGTYLWTTTDAELFKLDPSGEVLGVYSSPEVTPEGLTWDGATFWIFTTNYSDVYQFSIDESAPVAQPRIISSFESPNQRIGGTNDGLAWDGDALWYSDTYKVFRLDTAGNVLSSLAFGHEIAGIAWDGQQLWLAYNSFPDNAIFVKMDTQGNTLLTFNGPVYHIDALTWGDGHLWVSGTDSLGGPPMIYKIDVETTVIGRTPVSTTTAEEPELGTYSGITSQGRSVEFDVIEGSRAIGRVKFDVEGECPVPTSGVRPQPVGCQCEVQHETTMTKPWPIANNAFSYAPGDFEFSAVFDSTTTASGLLRIHTSGTPGGEAPCESDQVTWTASAQ